MVKQKTKKLWKKITLSAAGIGGLVHVAQPLGLDILSWFGGLSPWVQFLAGALTLVAVFMAWK